MKVQHQSLFLVLVTNGKHLSVFSAQHRLCDFCHEKVMKESLMSNYTILDDSDNETEQRSNVDLHFEVRPERLPTPVDNPSPPSE